MAQGRIGSLRLALARGELETAYQALQRMEALLEQEEILHNVPREEYVLWKVVARVEYWLASRNLKEAQAWAAQHLQSPETWDLMSNGEMLILVQVLLVEQHYGQAVELLSRFKEPLFELADIQTTIHFLVLSVVTLSHVGRRKEAWDSAGHLFALTEPEGYIRVYLDAGQPMKQALKMLLEAPSSADPGAVAIARKRSYITRLLAAFEQEEQKGAYEPDEESDNPQEALSSTLSQLTVASHAPELLDPLTAAELRVLRLLVAGRSNREIADALIVSLNTVKSHIKNLYSKLTVNNRMQASIRARDLHLL
jgi:LuxR family maltose regulon positive regulatory protein